MSQTYRMKIPGLSKYAYDELLAFCRQYPEKKHEAASLLGLRAVASDLPRRKEPGSPVEAAVLRRDRLLNDCRMIEQAAAEAAGGGWEGALIRNVCYQEAYDDLPREQMPSAHRSAFYAAKRAFFIRLKAIKEGDDL